MATVAELLARPLAEADQALNPVTIVIDGEPKGKGRPRFAMIKGHARAFTPKETRSYESALRLMAQIAMKSRLPIEGPVEIEVTALMPVPQSWPKWKREAALRNDWYATGKPDCDNLLKVIDGLNKIVFVDDSQIVTASIKKLFSAKPSLAITVTPLRVIARKD
jgi:Holliday junction resolvase RusA-like endonuclease